MKSSQHISLGGRLVSCMNIVCINSDKKQGTPMYEHGHHAISLPNKSSSTNLAVLKLESYSPAGERLLRGCRP